MKSPFRTEKLDRFWIFVIPVLAILVGRGFYLADRESWDFSVYWHAAHEWFLYGHSPFARYMEKDGFVYKYPPWTLPFFLPFGLVSLPLAKFLWFLIELGCIAYVLRWLYEQKVPRGALVLASLLSWWTFGPHFVAGQLTLVMTAAALYWERNRESTFRSSLLILLFSSKIFSMNSLMGGWKYLVRRSVVTAVVVPCLLLTAVVVGVLFFHDQNTSFTQVFHSWLTAAFSGGNDLPEYVVRGAHNQGLTAAVLRAIHANRMATHLDILVFLGLTAILLPLWTWASRRLNFSEQWAGYLALGSIVHPLTWNHSFVMAFPLGALALGSALRTQNRFWVSLSIFGIFSVGCLTANVLPDAWFPTVQLISWKAWGVCISAICLVACRKLEDQRIHPALLNRIAEEPA